MCRCTTHRATVQPVCAASVAWVVRAGFTMMEILVALSISTIVMLGVVSLLSLSSRAIPQPGGLQETSVNGADLFARLTADLACAMQITRADATAITLLVPDRTGDDVPETISYSWAGTAGNPVLRVVNGTGSTELLGSVDSLQFSYSRGPRQITERMTKSTGGSRVLKTNLTTIPTSETLRPTTTGTAILETALTTDDVVWTLKTLTLYFRWSGSKDDFAQIQIRGCDGSGDPTDTIYATVLIAESDMTGSLEPYTLSFPGIEVQAGERLCVVVTCLEGMPGKGKIKVGTAGSADSDEDATTLANPLSLEAIGTVTTITGGPTTRSAVTGVLIRVRAGAEEWKTQVRFPIVNHASIPPL